jgi:F-type H+-transporting ATPase subunit alpha
MKQAQFSPMPVGEMGVILYAANEGYLADVETSKIASFENALLGYMNSEHADLMADINKTGKYNDEIADTFKSAIEKFKATQTW